MVENPTQLLYLLDNLPGRSHDLLSTEENLVQGLTSDEIEITLPTSLSEQYFVNKNLVAAPIAVKDYIPLQDLPVL
ncbi:hypothetical protein DSO57_1031855 [Entomophthora muscae]|uniref:Uncharacterized protein n=1 Tax=Entomophthora muscae TaxID=34485 RepID=A0ACC2SPZ1_9FUNG|nr:hypothetical protein DSO57_1031855 [Entomophthora muscae]